MADDRVGRMVRVNNVVGRAAQEIAALPIEEQARWVIHVLATLDPCEAGSERFNEFVLRHVRDAIAARLETGCW